MSDGNQEDLPEQVLELQEGHYKFGHGPVVLRSFRVVAEVEFDGVRWWRVKDEVAKGTAIVHGNWVSRELYVATLMLNFRRTD